MRAITISELKALEGECWSDWITENLHPSPVDQWWDSFFAEWGDTQGVPKENDGLFRRFWDDSNTFCFYDSSDTLLGRFVRDPMGSFVLIGDGEDIRSSSKFTLRKTGQDERARGASVFLKPAII